MREKRIGIDCRLAGAKHAGIGRYVANLVTQLLKQPMSDVKLVLFFFDQSQAEAVLGKQLKNPQLEIVIAPIKHYGLSEQRLLPAIYRKAQLDLLHVPHWNVPLFYRGKLLITVHDLLWHQQKGMHMTTLSPWQYALKYLIYLYVVKQAVKKASVIFVPAATISETVAHYYPFAKDKIVVTKEGVSDNYRLNKTPQRVKKQLVYTGSLYPHKNLSLVIRSLHKLSKYKLLIVGARSVFQEQVQELVKRYKVKDQVQMLGYVNDKSLCELYQQSSALVQPSLSEGFGLTGLEAMAAGTPVLASDIPIFKEIYQDAAIFFDPHSTSSFVQAVKNLEINKRADLIKRGQRVALQYQWSKMAEITLQHYLTYVS